MPRSVFRRRVDLALARAGHCRGRLRAAMLIGELVVEPGAGRRHARCLGDEDLGTSRVATRDQATPGSQRSGRGKSRRDTGSHARRSRIFNAIFLWKIESTAEVHFGLRRWARTRGHSGGLSLQESQAPEVSRISRVRSVPKHLHVTPALSRFASSPCPSLWQLHRVELPIVLHLEDEWRLLGSRKFHDLLVTRDDMAQ